MLNKLIRGNRTTGHRLCDQKGNLVTVRRALLNGAYCVGTGVLRLLTGKLPAKPWISCDAIRVLRRHLNTRSRVLEFGSGMSTAWYSAHAGEVFSVENNAAWYERIKVLLAANGRTNANYAFAADEESYVNFMADDAKGFDLIMIDGDWRSQCVANALDKLRPGGILYIDNSDRSGDDANAQDMRRAEEAALEFARRHNAEVTYYTDFAPAQLFVQQGMAVRLPATATSARLLATTAAAG
jgi:predicted O-methyltransferase YrrM